MFSSRPKQLLFTNMQTKKSESCDNEIAQNKKAVKYLNTLYIFYPETGYVLNLNECINLFPPYKMF